MDSVPNQSTGVSKMTNLIGHIPAHIVPTSSSSVSIQLSQSLSTSLASFSVVGIRMSAVEVLNKLLTYHISTICLVFFENNVRSRFFIR